MAEARNEARNEYIEREAARKFLAQDYAYAAAELLKYVPAADVVEVVRCEDCDVPHNKWTGCPKLNGLIPPPDFYCAYGERKE